MGKCKYGGASFVQFLGDGSYCIMAAEMGEQGPTDVGLCTIVNPDGSIINTELDFKNYFPVENQHRDFLWSTLQESDDPTNLSHLLERPVLIPLENGNYELAQPYMTADEDNTEVTFCMKYIEFDDNGIVNGNVRDIDIKTVGYWEDATLSHLSSGNFPLCI